jgi:hypothetical protein
MTLAAKIRRVLGIGTGLVADAATTRPADD